MVIRKGKRGEKLRTLLRVAGFNSYQNIGDEGFEALGDSGYTVTCAACGGVAVASCAKAQREKQPHRKRMVQARVRRQEMQERLWLVDGSAGALGHDFACVLV